MIHDCLSRRELEVFLAIGHGRAVSEIAQAKNISVKTVSTYRERVLNKMGMARNNEIIIYVVKHDLKLEIDESESLAIAARQKNNRRRIKHGMSGTRIYSTWAGMISRCTDETKKQYKYYGGRGIKVCERWLDFDLFRADMGEPPEGTSLDRIDNDGGYEPANCRWATAKEQGSNKRNTKLVEWRGELHCIAEWERKLGMNPCVLAGRLKAGWPLDRAMTESNRSVAK